MVLRTNFEVFWQRYGRKPFEQTDFSAALDRLPEVSPSGPWVAGGSVRRLISSQPQDSDFDFFFASEDQFDAFCKRMKKLGAFEANSSDFNVTFILPSTGATSVDVDEFEPAGPELKVQAIRIDWFGSLEGVLESFDFSICQFGYDGIDLFHGQWSLYDLAQKRLVPGQIRYGTSSLRRIIKYTRQGYTICGGGLSEMLEQVVADPSIIQSDVEYID